LFKNQLYCSNFYLKAKLKIIFEFIVSLGVLLDKDVVYFGIYKYELVFSSLDRAATLTSASFSTTTCKGKLCFSYILPIHVSCQEPKT